MENYDQALPCYRQSIAINEANGDRFALADVLNRFGDTCQTVGDTLAADDAWRQALTSDTPVLKRSAQSFPGSEMPIPRPCLPKCRPRGSGRMLVFVQDVTESVTPTDVQPGEQFRVGDRFGGVSGR